MIGQLIAKFQDYGLLLSDQEIEAGQEAIPLLQDEDIADALWLAAKFQPTEKNAEKLPVHSTLSNDEEGTSTDLDIEEVDSDSDQSPQTCHDQPPSPVVSAYIPDQAQPETPSKIEGTGNEELPIQVKAAAALPNSLEMSRSLRPLMRKVPSRSRFEFDEMATVERIAKRDIWIPILKPAPERWLEIELVIEDSQFCFVWQDTLSEFQHLLEHHGAFRNIRTWHLNSLNTDEPQLFSKKAPRNGAVPSLMRSPKELVDPSGRRLILVVSDCRSQIWQNGQIHEWLSLWSKAGPLAVVQLLPQRLWSQSELDVGYTVQLSSLVAGCPNGRLKARGLPPRTIVPDASNLTFPVVTLAPKALKQWALVVAAVGRQRCPGRLFDLSWVNDPDRDQDLPVHVPKTPEARYERFNATASPPARKLAKMMAAVPVEMSVVHLIQQELLPELNTVHVAEVFSSGLLESDKTSSNEDPSRYSFVEGVREVINANTPLDETLKVIEALSQRIARTLGFEINSFAALLSPQVDWPDDVKASVLPFAQITTEVLYNLGGDFAEFAQRVEADAQQYKDWIRFNQIDGGEYPPLRTLHFETAQLIDENETNFPPLLQSEEFLVKILAIRTGPTIQSFEYQSAQLTYSSGQLFPPQLPGWKIQSQKRQGQFYSETLSDDLVLRMVSIPGGQFMMGSPEDEPGREDHEGLQHPVNVPTFFMGRYPVTQAQWEIVASYPEINLELDPDPSRFKGDNRPVEQVNWHETVEFCARLSAKTNRPYRLPSEAEWEYACRAGTTTPFYFGKTLTTDIANYNGDYTYNDGPKGKYREETTPVDRFKYANAYGLHDMHGNVLEWCQDTYHDNYTDAPEDGSAWIGDNSRKALRGGSWFILPRNCRSASRGGYRPDDRDFDVGFRVVCSAPSSLP